MTTTKKACMFEELKIKTSLLLPKLVLGATIVLVFSSIILAYGYITIGPADMITDSAKIMDQLTYKVIVNNGG